MIKKIFIVSWLLIAISLFLYSFTQVDLGLTLTKVSIWQGIQRSFQYIGYFNRPLSTYIFVALLFLMFSVYIWTLYLINTSKLDRKTLWRTIIVVSVIFLFSYNAFSYDLFNYMFDARIMTHYQENPYERRALDYPQDPMLGFMHWTHRTYPYGPLWLVLTVPFSFIGGDFFLFTFYLFKGLAVASYLGTVFFLEKILKSFKFENPLFHLAFFAFNPLVLIESLVSSHNDIVMMFFAVAGTYFAISNKWMFAFIFLLTSIGIKFSTVFVLPAFLIAFVLSKTKKNIRWNQMILATIFLMTFAIVGAIVRTEIQPWYLLYVLPFVSLIRSRMIRILAVCVSFGMLVIYFNLLYHGVWSKDIEEVKLWLVDASLLVGLIIYFLSFISKNSPIKNIFGFDKA